MRATLTKEFRFEAAHRLPNHEGGAGKCARAHGHSYRVVLEVEGPIQPNDSGSEEGMVVDFGRIKKAWEKVVYHLDHRDLNISIGPAIGPTTAENIAAWIHQSVRAELREGPGILRSTTVFETASSSATVQGL